MVAGPSPLLETDFRRARMPDTTLKGQHDGGGRAAVRIRPSDGASCALMRCVLWRGL